MGEGGANPTERDTRPIQRRDKRHGPRNIPLNGPSADLIRRRRSIRELCRGSSTDDELDTKNDDGNHEIANGQISLDLARGLRRHEADVGPTVSTAKAGGGVFWDFRARGAFT